MPFSGPAPLCGPDSTHTEPNVALMIAESRHITGPDGRTDPPRP